MTTKWYRVARVIAGCALAGVVLAACGQQMNDAPVVQGNETGDNTPAEIIAMPNGFSNLATKCDKYGNRVYTIYHATGNGAYGSVFVVPADRSCQK